MSSNIKNSLVFFIIGSSNPLKLEEEAEGDALDPDEEADDLDDEEEDEEGEDEEAEDLNGDEEEGDEEALFELELELEPWGVSSTISLSLSPIFSSSSSVLLLFTDSQKLHENLLHLLIYIICAVVELLIEPVVMYMNLHVENKFLPITVSSLSRVISNTIFIAFFNMDLWSFTLSRIIGSSVYILFIFGLGVFKYKLNFFEFIPRDINILYIFSIFIYIIYMLYI